MSRSALPLAIVTAAGIIASAITFSAAGGDDPSDKYGDQPQIATESTDPPSSGGDKEDAVDVGVATPIPATTLNDSFSGATAVSTSDPSSFEITISNADATIQSSEPTTWTPYYSSGRVTATRWVKWTAPRDGTIVATLAGVDPIDGFNVDPVLGIFTGSTMSTATRVAFNDDNGSGGFWSQTRLKVTKGKSYRFQLGVQCADCVRGNLTLSVTGHWNRPSNDNFASATTISSTGSFTASGTLLGATVEPGETTENPEYTPDFPQSNSVWWKWTPSVGGLLDLSVADVPGDFGLTLYSYSQAGGLEEELFEDADDAFTVQIFVPGTYYLKVTRVAGAVQNVTIEANYQKFGPSISTISPTSGKLAGGTKIKVTGSKFVPGSMVAFVGGQSAAVNCTSSTTCYVTTPSTSKTGPASVVLKNTSNGYETKVTSATKFTYK